MLARLAQLREVCGFIKSALNTYGYREGEQIMLMGDLNVNSTSPIYSPMWSKYFLAEHPDLTQRDLLENELFNEYKVMLFLLQGQSQFMVRDLLALANGGARPATYGHSSKVDGQEVPLETVLSDRNELSTNQSLDYAMHLTLNPEQNDVKVQPEVYFNEYARCPA